ncbi:MAG TPA: endopeptidase [Candidatus Hydrogenedentes bacterium]|nr:endopeptidase [Candidatus Hydrogenedentota bacterium]
MHTFDPTDIPGQERAQADSDQRGAQARAAEADDLQKLMATPWGRRIAWRWLDRAGVYRLSYSDNAMAMAFNEGRRNEGLRLLAQLDSLCPTEYLTLLKEAHDARDFAAG